MTGEFRQATPNRPHTPLKTRWAHETEQSQKPLRENNSADIISETLAGGPHSHTLNSTKLYYMASESWSVGWIACAGWLNVTRWVLYEPRQRRMREQAWENPAGR
jgi:hypothetical protein